MMSTLSSKARDLYFCLSLHLHPYFVFENSEGSGKSGHVQKIA